MPVDQRHIAATSRPRFSLPALTMAIPTLIFAVIALSIAFATSHELNLTDQQTSSLIVGLYGIPGILSLALTFAYRQPLMVAWNIPGSIFLASLAGDFTYNEMVGATMAAGLAVALVGAVGLSTRIAAILPASIVFGILAGLILPYVVRIFTDLGQSPLMIGAPVIAFFVGHRLLPARIPPVLLATIVGFVVAGIIGEITVPSSGWAFPEADGVMPSFSLAAILTIAPVITILIAVQGNLASTVYLEHEQYLPPRRLIDIATGLTTVVGSFLGTVPITMASLLTPLTAGPDAGDHRLRHWSVYASGAGFVVIALLAGIAAAWSTAVPASLLLALAGLALLGVLGQALREITRGPLYLGPLLAFAITSSELSLLGLGDVFWALVIGTGVSVLLEKHSLLTPEKTQHTE